jgi:hypothetical protein
MEAKGWYSVHKSPKLLPILSQIVEVHTTPSSLSNTNLAWSTILSLCLPSALSFWLSHQSNYAFLFSIRATSPVYFNPPRFDHSHYIW